MYPQRIFASVAVVEHLIADSINIGVQTILYEKAATNFLSRPR
jgi:hypothetical protein